MLSVLLELGVPQGQVVSRWKGGKGIFKEAMDRVKTASFTGYLKISLSKEGERSEGLISFGGGSPTLCLYVYQPSGMEEIWFMGEKAGEYLWYDATQAEAIISLHGEVSLRDFEQLFPGARIKRIAAPHAPLSLDRAKEEKLKSAEPGNSGEHMLGALGTTMHGSADRKKVDQQAQGVYDLILQYHKMQSSDQGINACKDCGGPIDLLGYCPRCASKDDRRSVVPRMDRRFTFDSFVVGTSSRFAEAAARAVAADPGYLYNPLLIHGRSGLGKTHLLQAIGHKLKKDRAAGLNVVYMPLESLEEQVLESLGNKQGELRQEMERADVLLIDDLQFLAGKERLQEELLRVINSLIPSGKQVVLTADRAPKEIPSLAERLTSRIESGLVVDMGQPDSATRLGILRKVVADEGLKIPEEVMGFVAEMCPDNVRQLEGGMNRVIAFASLMRSDVTLDIAREVLGHERAPGKAKKVELAERRSYIVEEPRPEHAYELLGAKIDTGFRGLVFSRSNPASVRERLGGRPAEIYWLTEHESLGERTVPPSLEKIVLLAEDHFHMEGPSIVLLDDLHYLISNATFDGVIRFVRSLVDHVSEHQAVFVVSVSPDSLKVQERSILERELEPIRP
jgi:archaellum biogenesis ATPase FlaH